MSEVILQGSLASFRLPDVLTFLAMSRKSGTLIMESGIKSSQVLFTNFADVEVTVFKGTSVGYVSSLAAATPHILWMDAGEELASFWGLVDKKGIAVSADEPLEPGIEKRD